MRSPLLLALAALALAPASRADTLVRGLDYAGLVAGGGPQPVDVTVSSDEGGSFDVSFDGPVGVVPSAPARLTLAPGAFGKAQLTFSPPLERGVIDVTVHVAKNGADVDRYPHRFVVDWPEPSDAEIASLGIRAMDGTIIDSKRALADEFAPVVRLSTPGPVGNDERFLPMPVEAGYRSAKLRRIQPVSQKRYYFPDFDSKPATELGVNVGSDGFLDLKREEWAKDSPDEAVALQAAATGLQPAIYATIADVDGVVTVQYWFYYLYNDWTNDHENDWEQVTVAFEGAPGAFAPAWIAGSRHQDGTWRAWSKTPKFVDSDRGPTQHPIAYVANGGHGVYLWGGDDAAGPLGNDNHDGSLTELVPAGLTSLRADSTELAIHLAPRLSDRTDPASRWLAYSGHWGYWDGSTDFLHSGTQGPPGPAFRAGAGLSSSRPGGEMWLFPKEWRDHGKGGDALGMDDEGEQYQNWVPHTLDATLSGEAPTLGVDRTYTCLAHGLTRTGSALLSTELLTKVVAEGPGIQASGSGSVKVRLDRGGRLVVRCAAASIENGLAYAEASDRLEYVTCPAATELVGFECRCLDGYHSPDPSRVDCVKDPEPQAPDAGTTEEPGPGTPDAGVTPGRKPGASEEGCNCGGGEAGVVGLAALAMGLRRRREGRGR